MKIVINTCYGGFGLSMAAVKRIAELEGRACYFFVQPVYRGEFLPVTKDTHLPLGLFWAFDVPNPGDVLPNQDNFARMSLEKRKASNEEWSKHQISHRDYERDDPTLVRVVEELGEAANGQFAALKIVEIPDGVEWEIDEYDGRETIAEVHRSWS